MNLAQEGGSWRTGKSRSRSRSHPARALFPMPCSGFPKAPRSCGSRWAGSRSEAEAQRPFLLFCLLEGGTSGALCASSEPPLPHARFSVSFSMCEMVRGMTGRRGRRLGVHCTGMPGHRLVLTQLWQPVSASCPRCTRLGSARAPSARGTGSLGDPGHWNQGCVCPSAAPSSQAAVGRFQHGQMNIGWAQGKAATLCR